MSYQGQPGLLDAVDADSRHDIPVCRIPSLYGLAHRRAPLGTAILPQELFRWTAAVTDREFRAANLAPSICVFTPAGKHPQLLAADSASRPDDVAASRVRYRPTKNAPSDDPRNERAQRALTPRAAYLLGLLLGNGVKYASWGTHIMPIPGDRSRFQIVLQPSMFIELLGLESGGDAYAVLESHLAELAQFQTVKEYRDGDAWRSVYSGTLLHEVDTGRVHVKKGVRHDTQAPRRSQRWVVELGRPVLDMLACDPDYLTVVSPGLWAAASRSRLDQWLALWLSGHGFDGRQIHDYRADTLAERMRLPADSVLEARRLHERHISLIEPLAQRTSSGEVLGSASEAIPALSPEAIVRASRQCWRQLKQAIARMGARRGLHTASWITNSNPSDVRPSRVGRVLSGSDKILVRRWSKTIEAMIDNVQDWSRQQWDGLVSRANTLLNQFKDVPNKVGEAARSRFHEAITWASARPGFTPEQFEAITRQMQDTLALLKGKLVYTQASPSQWLRWPPHPLHRPHPIGH